MNMIEIRTCRSQESRWARILKMMWRQPRSARSATTSTILLTSVVKIKSIWTDHFCPSSLFTRHRCCDRSNWLKITKARHFCHVQPAQVLTQMCPILLSLSSCALQGVDTVFELLFARTPCFEGPGPDLTHSRLTRQNVKSPSCHGSPPENTFNLSTRYI